MEETGEVAVLFDRAPPGISGIRREEEEHRENTERRKRFHNFLDAFFLTAEGFYSPIQLTTRQRQS